MKNGAGHGAVDKNKIAPLGLIKIAVCVRAVALKPAQQWPLAAIADPQPVLAFVFYHVACDPPYFFMCQIRIEAQPVRILLYKAQK